MDSTPEQKEPTKPEVINLNQEFLLFDPNSTLGSTDYRLVSSIILDTGSLPGIPIHVNAKRNHEYKFRIITPFDPEEGYQITQEDLTPETRVEKWKRVVQSTLVSSVDMEKAPLGLHVAAEDISELNKLGLCITYPDPDNPDVSHFKFKPEVEALLKRLRLLLFFPNSTFEAKPVQLLGDLGDELAFWDFYPLDAGPLPKPPYLVVNQHTPEGYHLQLPSDPEKLRQIRARFILVDQDSEEVEEEKRTEIPEVFRKAFEDKV